MVCILLSALKILVELPRYLSISQYLETSFIFSSCRWLHCMNISWFIWSIFGIAILSKRTFGNVSRLAVVTTRGSTVDIQWLEVRDAGQAETLSPSRYHSKNRVQLGRQVVPELGSTQDQKWFWELLPTTCAGGIYSQGSGNAAQRAPSSGSAHSLHFAVEAASHSHSAFYFECGL